MSATRRVNLVAAAVLLRSPWQAPWRRSMPSTTCGAESVAQEALYLRSSKVLRRMSLGYTGLLADIYWTRAVQYFGKQHHSGTGDFRLLAPLLEVTTELDPKLLPAYQFGANFLAPKPPSGAGLPGAALALIQVRNRAQSRPVAALLQPGISVLHRAQGLRQCGGCLQAGSSASGDQRIHAHPGGTDGAACGRIRHGAHVVGDHLPEHQGRTNPAERGPTFARSASG